MKKARVKCVLGIDTSNYKTSVALVDRDKNIICDMRRLLKVKQGERGLRQSDALFQHIKNMPELIEEMKREADRLCADGYEIETVACSSRPRPVKGSYMPVFLAGESCGRSIASVLNVPCLFFSHQEGHIEAVKAFSEMKDEEHVLACHFSGGTCEVLSARSIVADHDDTDRETLPGAANCEIASGNNAAHGDAVSPDGTDSEYLNGNAGYKNAGYEIEIVGGSKDISFGQVIDRAGVELGMSFPAGEEMDRIAIRYAGEESIGSKGTDSSSQDTAKAAGSLRNLTPIRVRDGWLNLSGIDTQMKRILQSDSEHMQGNLINDGIDLGTGIDTDTEKASNAKRNENDALIAELFEKISDAVIELIVQCCGKTGIRHVIMAGGVSSSVFIRNAVGEELKRNGINAEFDCGGLSQDNAVGTALLGGRSIWG